MLFIDSETVGYHGPIVLLQWAEDDGPIQLYNVWQEPVEKTIKLLEWVASQNVIGFNLVFDWFHICQMYTTMLLLKDKSKPPNVEEYAYLEPAARLGPCLKPAGCLDLMMHARKTTYQSTMPRKPITIRRVPTQLAWDLANELGKRIILKDIYFAKNADPTQRWKVKDVPDRKDVKNLVLKFNPTSKLKALAFDALGYSKEQILELKDIGLGKRYKPVEYGYAPFALAVCPNHIPGSPNWNGAWPEKISEHISYWYHNPIARQYGTDDITYTRGLYKYFNYPELNDDDSVLTCMVGAVRWRGYDLDIPKLKALKAKDEELLAKCGFKFGSSKVCLRYLKQAMSKMEQLALIQNEKETTKGLILEEVAKWKEKVEDPEGSHPAALRAREILDLRHAKKELEVFDKLLIAGRFHASFNVIGALSSRMSGADDLNPQGIKKAAEIRSCFNLVADRDKFALCGGDFESFEICLMVAAYNDPVMNADVLSGKKLHGIFGTFLFPPLTYEEVVATDGLPGELNKYTRAKSGVFAMGYFGTEDTLVRKCGVLLENAKKAIYRWRDRYRVFAKEVDRIVQMFCSMKQPAGIGTKVEWHEPADYMESLTGFKRFFTLENSICKALFTLANNPPKEWKNLRVKVTRRDREQTVSGAIQSALYAAAFGLQGANTRAAGNHKIQSSGATLCKKLQRRIWDLQPAGVNEWLVQPMNVHDEILSPTVKELVAKVSQIVKDFIIETKVMVPLLGIKWHEDMQTWADK